MPINLAYRMRIYAGLYSDETATTVLTPAAGAPHSDPFQVATIQGIGGYQPYMNAPRGKRGSLSVPEQKLEVGSYTIDLLDKRTGDSNINRWVTAFFGNIEGKLTLIGKKAFIEESTDGGSSWNPFFVGQVSTVSLSNPLQISITIKDNVLFLKEEMFKNYPNSNYAIHKTLSPVGVNKNLINNLSEVIVARKSGLEISKIEKRMEGNREAIYLTVSSRSRNDKSNLWPLTSGLMQTNPPSSDFTGLQLGGTDLAIRMRLEIGGTPYVFRVRRLVYPRNTNTANARPAIEFIEVEPIASWEVNYGSSSVIPTGTVSNVVGWIYSYEPTEERNGFWLVGEWDEIVGEALDGEYYTPLQISGSLVQVARKTPYDSSNLAAVKLQNRIPPQAFYIEKEMSGLDFLEKYCFAPYSVGYTMTPILNGSLPQSQLQVFSTTQPTSLTGISTLSGSIAESALPQWDAEEPITAVSISYYEEFETRLSENSNDGSEDDVEVTKRRERKIYAANTVDRALALNNDSKFITVDANGLRSFISLANQTPDFFNLAYPVYMGARALEFAQLIYYRFNSGITKVGIKTIRNGTTNSLQVGQFVFVEVEMLPNQATNTRGGTRLMQIVNKYSAGVYWQFELLDAGLNSTMSTPSLGTITSTGRTEVSFNVTTTQKAIVQIQYAITTTPTAPTSDSLQWIVGQELLIDNTTLATKLTRIPEGYYVYVRARSIAPPSTNLRLPSPYTVSNSLLMANIPTPGAVSVSEITDNTAKVTWTNTDNISQIEVWLASPAGTLTTKVATLSAGSTVYYLTGLGRNSSTSHRVGIRYADQYQGFGLFSIANFTATGTSDALDAPAAIRLFIART